MTVQKYAEGSESGARPEQVCNVSRRVQRTPVRSGSDGRWGRSERSTLATGRASPGSVNEAVSTGPGFERAHYSSSPDSAGVWRADGQTEPDFLTASRQPLRVSRTTASPPDREPGTPEVRTNLSLPTPLLS